MFLTQSVHRGLVGLCLVVLVGLSISAERAQAQIPPTNLEHYLLVAKFPDFVSARITLKDQFVEEDVDVVQLDGLLVPASKNGGEVLDPVTHYSFYRLASQPIDPRAVEVTNQFGTFQYRVAGSGNRLLAPAIKNHGSAVLPDADHFRCYGIDFSTQSPLGVGVSIETQFGPEQAELGYAGLLCNPAEKTHDGVTFPVRNPDEHLVCYALQLSPYGVVVDLRDQFTNRGTDLANPVAFCVPSTKKEIPVPTDETTWGKVKTIYR